MRSPILNHLLAIGLWCTCATGAMEDVFTRRIEVPARDQDEIIAVPLDKLVYANTRSQFTDLRIMNDAAVETPYLLRQVLTHRSRTERRVVSSSVASLRELTGNRIEVTVNLHPKADAVDGMTLSTPLRNYERRVTVLGAPANGEDWRPLATDSLLFDYTRYMDISNTHVKLAPNNCQRFRVLIEEVTDRTESPIMTLTRHYAAEQQTGRTERTTVRTRPFRIDRISCWHEYPTTREEVAVKSNYNTTELAVDQDPELKRTIVTLRSQREPLTGFTLRTSTRNFHRRAIVQVPVTRGVTREWREVGAADIHAVHFRGYHQADLTVTFPEQRCTEYRLTLENHDNPPLAIDGVTAVGNTYQALFLAAPKTNYQVRYGTRDDEAPRYDTATIRTLLQRGYAPVQAQLGPGTPPEQRAPSTARVLRDLIDSRLFFGAAICITVLGLAWGLFRAAHIIDSLPEE